jgi:hypothetical protein
MVSSYPERWCQQSQKPDDGNRYKGKVPSTYTMLRDARTAGNKIRLAIGGHRDIGGRLPVLKNVAQAP